MSQAGEFTTLLHKAAGGDRPAADAVFPVIYDELRRLAAAFLAQERAGHTLPTTALVHEAYFKLVGTPDYSFTGRAHFLAVAAQAMRRILITHARDRKRQKRGGGARVSLSEAERHTPAPEADVDLVALDEAMTRLAALDERKARLVEMRFFAGMSVEEVAEALGVGTATVKRDWAMARAWLFREISKEGEGDPGAVGQA
ncbi:MAG: sigma-70 family RNA polymerase sigma factor [Dehalococcoidia bacterium]|nr:sigma-70 family RNA polymerase sigma factor [Dehalococcoidia bacterium]